MCKQCIKNPVYEFTNKRKLCKNCFINYIHKKLFYAIRKFEMIKQEDIISFKKTDNFRDVVLDDLLRLAEIKMFAIISSKKSSKKAISSTLDIESKKIIYELINGNINKLNAKPVDKSIIKPMYFFLDEEVLLYAKLKKLKYKIKKEKKDKINLFIDDLEKKHPEIKRAIVNSYLGMNE
ncbi:MAG: hypothetical protein AABW81_00445 [Nanoarchaeota archaeon]